MEAVWAGLAAPVQASLIIMALGLYSRLTSRRTRVLLFSVRSTFRVQCCFTSTETIRIFRDGVEPRTATSTFTVTQPLSSDSEFEHGFAIKITVSQSVEGRMS